MAQSLPGPLDPTLPQDYERERLNAFDAGVNYAVEPSNLPTNSLSEAENLYWFDGQILVDTGYGPFGPPVAGQPQLAYQVYYPDGTSELLLVTTASVYRLLGGNTPQWQYVHYSGPSTITTAIAASGQAVIVVSNPAGIVAGTALKVPLSNGILTPFVVLSVAGPTVTLTTNIPAPGINANAGVSVVNVIPTLTIAAAAGATSLTLSSIQGIAIGSKLGLALSNGQQWQFIVGGIAGSVVTATTACPAPGANLGAQVVIAPALAGNLNVQVSAVVFPAIGWVIISNGEDPISYYFQGVLATLPGLPNGTTCRAMNVFHEQLILLNTTENGMDLPQQVRASDQGDPTGWTPGQNGIAAIYPLVDTEDFILAANLLGPWMIIYRETTIMRCTYLGLPNQTLFFEYMIYGEGIQSQGSVAELGETHFIVGTQNIYTYDGGYALVPVGNNVFARLLSAKGELNAQAKQTIFTQYVGENDEVLLFYPAGTQTLPGSVLRCSLEKNAWYHRTFPDTFVSAGYFLPLLTTTWASAVGTWAQNTTAWDSRVFLLNAPVLILCAPAKQSTFVYDYTTKTDNGAVIPWSMAMKDMGRGDAIERWDSILFYGQGNGITVQFALDPPFDTDPSAPVTVYTTMTDANGLPMTLNFGAGLSRQRLTFDNASTYIRIRLSGADPSFSLVYAEMWSSFESEY
jgi:hypothetical protein